MPKISAPDSLESKVDPDSALRHATECGTGEDPVFPGRLARSDHGESDWVKWREDLEGLKKDNPVLDPPPAIRILAREGGDKPAGGSPGLKGS